MKKFFTEEISVFLFIVFATIVVSSLLNISIWKSTTFALVLFCLFLLKILFLQIDRINKLSDNINTIKNSKQYRLTRTYNEKGEELQNRFTEVVEEGYWVTVVTNIKNFQITHAEHTRTDENINKNGRENCQKQEHSYNYNMIWGKDYEGDKIGEKIIIVKD